MSADGLHWVRRFNTYHPDVRVTSTEMAALMLFAIICDDEGRITTMSQAEIADHVRVTRKTMVGTLSSLEEKGFIRREPGYWADSGKRKIDRIYLLTPGVPGVGSHVTKGDMVHVTKGDTSSHVTKGDTSKDNSSYNLSITNSASDDGALIPAEAVDQSPLEDQFAEWWGLYPKKVDKRAAKAVFMRLLKKNEVTYAELLTGLHNYRKSQTVRSGYIKNATTWLNSGSWEDEQQPSHIPNDPWARKGVHT